MQKKSYQNIIFDADGTMIDTLDGIMQGFNFAMQKLNRPLLTREQVKPFLGPSIMDTMQNTLDLTSKEAARAIEYYREFYWDTGYAMCDFFDGIEQLLKDLKAAGKTLSVATNKPQPFIDAILKEKGYYDYFSAVVGPDLSDPSSDKTPLVKRAMLDKNAVMIGDRYVDINAANNNGIDSVGVVWGSAESGEFEKFKPTYIAHKPGDILNIVE